MPLPIWRVVINQKIVSMSPRLRQAQEVLADADLIAGQNERSAKSLTRSAPIGREDAGLMECTTGSAFRPEFVRPATLETQHDVEVLGCRA